MGSPIPPGELFAYLNKQPTRINEVTESLLPFGHHCIRQWRGHRKYMEVVSEMQLALLKAVTRVGTNGIGHENVLSYISSTIRHRVKDFLLSDGLIRLSHTAIQKLLRSNRQTPRVMEGGTVVGDQRPSGSTLEIDEIIALAKLDPREQFLLSRYMIGEKDIDIAKQFGNELNLRTVQSIGRMRRQICVKIQKILDR